MGHGLAIPADGAFDLVALGALVHRLDPGITPFRKATQCQIHVSGAEFNVAADLADCFGMRTGFVTAMVDYPIGALVAERVRAVGVHPFYTWFEHDGVTGPNIATVYSDRGFGVRAPVVFYNRSNEAAAQLTPGDVDWDRVFSGGVRWFHTGGLFAALSESAGELQIEGMRAARSHGAVVSFDLNYRAKLWTARGGPDTAHRFLDRAAAMSDVLIGNEEDLQVGLGVHGPDIANGSALEPNDYAQLMEEVVKRYPSLRVVATTLREVHSANRHGWSAVAWIDGRLEVAPTCELDVLDRVGSGDGFAAGFFYGLLKGETPAEAMRLGWAHGALVASYPGDTSMATAEQVVSLAHGASARIQR
jgi:2-dehydro-3-deoxygluconokinase